eukprot:Partr_v1_DN28587_c0_g1_i5_m73504 putative DNA Topoisomerase
MKVLCVAEKNSIAKSVSSILGNGTVNSRNGRSQYNRNYEIQTEFQGSGCTMVVTSVSGHLLATEFKEGYRKWHECRPVELFEAPIEKFVPEQSTQIAANLKQEVRYSTHLVIWTDCDREGENIGWEIVQVCREVKPSIQVWRARFSVVLPREIKHAIANLTQLDMRMSNAVDVRSEMDLRVGAAFTRFQTQLFQAKFPELDSEVISYGPCQFPTLGFVVEQYWKRQRFIAENFWLIDLAVTKNNINTKFLWSRHVVFDRHACLVLYEMLLENPIAKVTSVNAKPSKKWRPLPLTTVEMQKMASIYLKMPSSVTMKVAEDLYNKGIISYPRTETNTFDRSYKLKDLISSQSSHTVWGNYATSLVNNDKFQWPRDGKADDHAHPPIHPTKCATDLSGNDKRLYEMITRRFLACCSKDAEGETTTVTITVNGERFTASGLRVIAANYLDVYPYEKWSSHSIAPFTVGEQFLPTSCEMREGRTTPPSLLTEAALIATMDVNGIGTDATIAEHIKKITERNYAYKEGDFFYPTTLGLALVDGYDKIGFEESLAKPNLRKETETNLKLICEGVRNPAQVIQQWIHRYSLMFQRANENARVLLDTFTELNNATDESNNANPPNAGPSHNNGGTGNGNEEDSDDSDDDNGGGDQQPFNPPGHITNNTTKPRCKCGLIAKKTGSTYACGKIHQPCNFTQGPPGGKTSRKSSSSRGSSKTSTKYRGRGSKRGGKRSVSRKS